MSATNGWVCQKCGERHEGVAFSFVADYPDAYGRLTEAERSRRAVLSSDRCELLGRQFFLWGSLELPILGSPDPFVWGLWVKVFEADYKAFEEFRQQSDREDVPGPFKGRLNNSLKCYPETLNLKVTLEIQPAGTPARIIVDEPKHPLAVDQGKGISRQRAEELASFALHGA